jgi:hypothetical protein
VNLARPADDYPSRPSHRVDTPEGYDTWRDYAFSSAPELAEHDEHPATPVGGIRTV